MSDIPDYLNLNKRRAEKKRTGRSLEKFASNSISSNNNANSESRTRINSVFRLKLRDLHEVRNKKKMSQSMIRSQKLELGNEAKNSQRRESCETSSPVILKKHRVIKNHFGKAKGKGIFDKIRYNNSVGRKYSRAEDQNQIQSISKSGIQGIITPVVQISYNQIKSEKGKLENTMNYLDPIAKPLHSQRGIRLDLMQSIGNKDSQRNKEDGLRTESDHLSYNKRSFVSMKEGLDSKTPRLLSSRKDNTSTSFQQNLNIDEDGVDECSPGENILNNRANSVNESVHYNKRSMSEMQKSIGHTIVISKPFLNGSNRFKDRNKNQIFTP